MARRNIKKKLNINFYPSFKGTGGVRWTEWLRNMCPPRLFALKRAIRAIGRKEKGGKLHFYAPNGEIVT